MHTLIAVAVNQDARNNKPWQLCTAKVVVAGLSKNVPVLSFIKSASSIWLGVIPFKSFVWFIVILLYHIRYVLLLLSREAAFYFFLQQMHYTPLDKKLNDLS